MCVARVEVALLSGATVPGVVLIALAAAFASSEELQPFEYCTVTSLIHHEGGP
jgi:hypothetical protein